MNILVTGGLGYIGSHTVVDLLQHGHEVFIADDCSNASEDVLDHIFKITGIKPGFQRIDLKNKSAVDDLFNIQRKFDGVIHFAAHKYVDESVEQPLKYYENNLLSLLHILENVQRHHIPYFVFSSSCSVYGNIQELPVTEMTALEEAQSPYARTKQIGENIIEDFTKSGSTHCISLRYFNPVGAHESNDLGESPMVVSNNLIPRITATAIGKHAVFQIYGTDYPTRDGTCIRDYIHVMDISNAHTKSLDFLAEKTPIDKHTIINLGSGNGISVREMVDAFTKTTGAHLNVAETTRRPGDVIAVYADNSKAKALLNWSPTRNIEDIMRTAWNWEVKNSKA
ncbi:MAG: UDP-glucose 4-epimerase GalE [Bacteroidetes bacterium]|nr:UDP-glucose 4-epimerase GalE [Bacteroidota bacterium]